MKKTTLIIFVICVIFNSNAQSALKYSMQMEAVVDTINPKITLKWKRKLGADTVFTIYKKKLTDVTFTSSNSFVTKDTFYEDIDINQDFLYEYMIYSTKEACGTVLAGYRKNPIHYVGKILVLIDSIFMDSCKIEIEELLDDISNDGWEVYHEYVNRNDKDVHIKSIINNYYDNYSLRSVLLLGHIPVSYMGKNPPDGHSDHSGAWSSDMYYSDVDGVFTDNGDYAYNYITRPQNKNYIGDGKWDFDFIFGGNNLPELEISRIDFYDMNLFGKTEIQLLKNYLRRNHLYKMGKINTINKGLIDDNFSYLGEYYNFANNGWRNFSSLCGIKNIISNKDYLMTLKDSAYKWSYGCGAGTYTSASGIGSSIDFKDMSFKGIFTMLYGSYFGDWDNPNNFLRAPLCAKEPALTSSWVGSGGLDWSLHHMVMGEHIGNSGFKSFSNRAGYRPNGGVKLKAHNLMGDLTLRNDYISPINNLKSQVNNNSVKLNWSKTDHKLEKGYYIYRSNKRFGKYELISSLIHDTFFNDIINTKGKYYYMVRATYTKLTPTGYYNNLSLGIKDSVIITNNLNLINIDNSNIELYPNPVNTSFNLISQNMIGSEYRIYSSQGKLCYNSIIQSNTEIVDVSDYNNGIYFIVFNNIGKSYKIIIHK